MIAGDALLGRRADPCQNRTAKPPSKTGLFAQTRYGICTLWRKARTFVAPRATSESFQYRANLGCANPISTVFPQVALRP